MNDYTDLIDVAKTIVVKKVFEDVRDGKLDQSIIITNNDITEIVRQIFYTLLDFDIEKMKNKRWETELLEAIIRKGVDDRSRDFKYSIPM